MGFVTDACNIAVVDPAADPVADQQVLVCFVAFPSFAQRLVMTLCCEPRHKGRLERAQTAWVKVVENTVADQWCDMGRAKQSVSCPMVSNRGCSDSAAAPER